MSGTTKINGAYNYQAGICEAKAPDKALNDARVRQQVKSFQPNYSECAYVGTRPLSWSRGYRYEGEQGGILDSANKQFAHQHIAWAQSGDNVGWGPDGITADPKLFSEDVATQDYRWQPECYDGAMMREAVADTAPPSRYLFLFNNCQTYIEGVITKYQSLLGRIFSK